MPGGSKNGLPHDLQCLSDWAPCFLTSLQNFTSFSQVSDTSFSYSPLSVRVWRHVAAIWYVMRGFFFFGHRPGHITSFWSSISPCFFFWHSFSSDHVKRRFALVVHTQEMQRFVCNCKHIPKAAHVLGVMTHTAVWRKVILRHAGVKLGSRVRRNRFQKGNRTPWSQCENNPYLSKLFQSGTETFRRTLRIQTLHKNS